MPHKRSLKSFSTLMSFYIIGVYFIIFTVQSCSTYSSELASTSDLYNQRRYEEALDSIENLSILKKNNNRLLYLLEKATVLEAMSNFQKSRSTFIDADKLADRLYTESISKSALSYLYNDSTTDYAGEDYEKIMIHSILALSFLKEQNLGSALVEARKINNKLYEISSSYQNSSYKEDALARFLSGLIYESRSEYDNAIIDYKKALSLYESNYFKVAVPSSLVESLYTVLSQRSRKDELRSLEKKYPYLKQYHPDPSSGYVITIRRSGLISKKVSRSFSIPVDDQIVSISFPVIVDVSSARFQERSLIINGSSFSKDQLVQDMNSIARTSLEEKRVRLIAKTSARALLRVGMSKQLTKNGSDAALIANLALQISSMFTEKADTRSWNLCPASFYISRTKLKPG